MSAHVHYEDLANLPEDEARSLFGFPTEDDSPPRVPAWLSTTLVIGGVVLALAALAVLGLVATVGGWFR